MNISGETSSALWVLLDRVKPVWADAQGDHSELSVDIVGPLLTRFCWLRFEQTKREKVLCCSGVVAQSRVGYVWLGLLARKG